MSLKSGASARPSGEGVRLAELLAALSLGSDLGMGLPRSGMNATPEANQPVGTRPDTAQTQVMATTDWRDHGVAVIPADALDPNTPQTPGMTRAAAITFTRVGARKLWAGTVSIQPNAKTGAHHHGHLESVIYVVEGRARMRWGERLEFVAEAGPGDFIYVPPWVPHQEINASENEPLRCMLVRSDSEAIAISLDIDEVEKPETVHWVDPTHPHPAAQDRRIR